VPATTSRLRRRGGLVAGVTLLLALSLLAAGCGGSGGEEEGQPPAATEQVKGSDAVRVVMTPEAAKRIGVKLTAVTSDPADGGRAVIPYGAVLYDPDGTTWTYTSPKPNVFQREDIEIAHIAGNSAFLAKGPPVGAEVVTVGATEIWGVEYGGIEED
jgi:hypothetical protein